MDGLLAEDYQRRGGVPTGEGQPPVIVNVSGALPEDAPAVRVEQRGSNGRKRGSKSRGGSGSDAGSDAGSEASSNLFPGAQKPKRTLLERIFRTEP